MQMVKYADKLQQHQFLLAFGPLDDELAPGGLLLEEEVVHRQGLAEYLGEAVRARLLPEPFQPLTYLLRHLQVEPALKVDMALRLEI